MTKYTTQDCKDLLESQMNLTNTDWKRVSKNKDSDGWITRVFECKNNSVSAEVLEMEAGLMLGRVENLGNSTTLEAIKTSKPVEEAVKDIETPEIKETTKLEEEARILSQKKYASIDTDKIKALYESLMEVYGFSNWIDYLNLEKGIAFIQEDEETQYIKPADNKDYYNGIDRMTFKFLELTPLEKEAFLDIMLIREEVDLLGSVGDRVFEVVESTAAMDWVKKQSHCAPGIGYNTIGLDTCYRFLAELFTVYSEYNVEISDDTIYSMARARQVIKHRFEDAFLKVGGDYHKDMFNLWNKNVLAITEKARLINATQKKNGIVRVSRFKL